jgi:hypothetical protein
MAIAYVTGVTANLGVNGGTTSSVDSTGGNLVVVAVASYEPSAAPTVSDSKGNTYNALTEQIDTGSHRIQLFYAANATVGSGHTFTVSGSTSYSSISVNVFSGAKTTSPFDQQNGAGTGSSPLSTGSVTPTENDEVIVAGIGLDSAASALSINGGFSTPAVAYFAGGSAYGVGSAYLIQTTAAAANPAWSWTGGDQQTAAIATFKVASAAAATPYNLLLLGVG